MPSLISIDDLKNGMVLAEAVKNKYGQVLLAKNAVINANHPKIFRTWGVETIMVHDDNVAKPQATFNTSLVASVRQGLIDRLQWEPMLPQETDLLEMAVNSFLRRQPITTKIETGEEEAE